MAYDPGQALSVPPSAPLDVVIIEDLPDVWEGLAVLINSSSGFRCARGYPTMEDALAGIAHDHPHVILTDLGLPGISGIDGIALLRERMPDVPIWP